MVTPECRQEIEQHLQRLRTEIGTLEQALATNQVTEEVIGAWRCGPVWKIVQTIAAILEESDDAE